MENNIINEATNEATIEATPVVRAEQTDRAEQRPVREERGERTDRGDRYSGQNNDREGRFDKNGRPRRRRKVCSFCVDKVSHIDYKDYAKLRRFLSERGKILPCRMTGTCAPHQRQLTSAIKRARHIALLPYTTE